MDGGADAGDSAIADVGTDRVAPDALSDSGPACAPIELPPLQWEEVVPAGSVAHAVDVAQPNGVPDTLFVVEQTGLVRLIRDGAVLARPFLDLSGVVDCCGERGLLGLAFDPDYATSGRFFVAYTTASPLLNVIAEYRRSSGDPDVADPTEVARLVEVDDPQPNHNGGGLRFGPDGMLYASLGDGGGACDRHGTNGNGQSLDTLLGKLLRLDIDATASGYAPADNPFAAPIGLPQIFLYGLRNPWRFSFDSLTGDLYIGDVGQGVWEELDFVPPGAGGLNLGWRAYEGPALSPCDPTTVDTAGPLTEPVYAYQQESTAELLREGCAIIGGQVYRGTAIPELDGVYLFGDRCSADFAVLRVCEGEAMYAQRVPGLALASRISSFGVDGAGEILTTSFGGGPGGMNGLYRLVRAP